MFRKNNNDSSIFGRKIAGPIRRFGSKVPNPRGFSSRYGNNGKPPPPPKLEKN
jgi:hypothetical protein